MSNVLVLGLAPVVLFFVVEEVYGTWWGLVAAIVWAVLECVYEWFKNRKVSEITLVSSGLVIVLGGVGAWLDESFLFKFQPVIMEVIFVGILYWGNKREEPLLFTMGKKMRPELDTLPPPMRKFQMEMMRKLSREMIVLLLFHAALLSYLALRPETYLWAAWKGFGVFALMGVWFVFRRSMAKRR